jgi:prophage regulatory protein
MQLSNSDSWGCLEYERHLMHASNSDSQVQILRLPAVKERTGLATSSVYNLIQRGTFPRPVSLSTKTVGWPAHEIDAWIADRIAARDAKTAA